MKPFGRTAAPLEDFGDEEDLMERRRYRRSKPKSRRRKRREKHGKIDGK